MSFALVIAMALASGVSAAPASGIVSSIVKAPIAPDGDVAGAPTDFVINLDISLDPSIPGRTLLAGKTVKITLPEDFVNLGLPIALPGPPPNCPPPSGTCNTGVLLQGWPQNPIPPVSTNYTLSLEGSNTIVYTAMRDLVSFDPTINGPGLKQMHLILRGFVNPKPGIYTFYVEAETGPGGALETGSGPVHIRPNDRASINVTSVFNPPPPFPNTIFQQTVVNTMIPLDWDFLLWDNHGEPAVGVTIRQVNRQRAQLVNGRKVVGQIFIDAPRGARGQEVMSAGPSTLINGPVLGLPTGRLTVFFLAGDTPGLYMVTFKMNNGNTVEMYVDVIN